MAAVIGTLLAVFVIAFLLGSIPWGVILSKGIYHKDIRDTGSGNIGTTNAFRALGKAGGVAVFVLDFGKGILAGLVGIWLAQWVLGTFPREAMAFATALLGPDAAVVPSFPLDGAWALARLFTAVAFLGCVLGHVFSPWLHFKGGKGIAVAAGCLFLTFGVVGGSLEILIFAVVVLATRYVSAGSVASAVACPFFALWYDWGNVPAWLCCLVGASVVVWAHRGNIQRLRTGTERRIGGKGKNKGEDSGAKGEQA